MGVVRTLEPKKGEAHAAFQNNLACFRDRFHLIPPVGCFEIIFHLHWMRQRLESNMTGGSGFAGFRYRI